MTTPHGSTRTSDTAGRAAPLELPERRFHGIVPPLVTPLLAADVLDIAGLERLVGHVLGGGVHGLFLLGTTGEGPSLSHAVQRDLVQRVMSLVDGSVPVLVGITDTAVAESVALARVAAESGATAVVAAPPYYFPMSSDALACWASQLAERVPLPLVLYNMPEMTKVSFGADTVRRLADSPTIVGFKDSSGDLGFFADVAAIVRDVRPDWSLFVGPELLLPEAHAIGGHGGIPGGANVCPRLFVDLYEALVAGDSGRVAALVAQVRVLARIYDVGRMPGRIIVGIKAALAARGICGTTVASSFEQFDDGQSRRIHDIVASLPM
ncbi:MAG: dihydrodipicolinate synthase family protein [Planctomycetia bacterium]|nr:dihydrodipicolinate synthase family protein [Planctomycetia bacterium]